jgi:hypothetical protein
MDTNRITSKTRQSPRALRLFATLIPALALFASAAAPAAAASLKLDPTGAIPVVARLVVFAMDGDKGGALEGAGILVFDQYGTAIEKGLTDSEGVYITYLSDGPHKVRVSAEGYAEITTVVEMTLGFDTELAVKLQSMTVPPGTQEGQRPERIEEGRLEIYARDAASGKAVGDATVQVLDEYGMEMIKGSTSAQDGRFDTRLPFGTYKVWVWADGYIEDAQVVQIDENGAAVVKAALQRNSTTTIKPATE